MKLQLFLWGSAVSKNWLCDHVRLQDDSMIALVSAKLAVEMT